MISPSCSLKTPFAMTISDEPDAQSYTLSGHLWFAPEASIFRHLATLNLSGSGEQNESVRTPLACLL
jgi:hypothetical protein